MKSLALSARSALSTWHSRVYSSRTVRILKAPPHHGR